VPRGPKYDPIAPAPAEPEPLLVKDASLLARLVRRYGPDFVSIAVKQIPKKVLGRKRGRPAKSLGAPEFKVPLLAKRDARGLVRLVRRYGADFISTAAKQVPKEWLDRKRGRPARVIEAPYLLKMHCADLIEEWAEEHRVKGSRSPYRDAYREYQHFDGKKSLETIERYHQRGRRFWELWAHHLRQRGSSLPSWLERRLSRRQ